MSFPVWQNGKPPPPGVGGACDAMDGKAPLPFGSCIYASEADITKFRAEDLKARAVDVDKWYDNFIINGLPKKVPKTANEEEFKISDVDQVLSRCSDQTIVPFKDLYNEERLLKAKKVRM